MKTVIDAVNESKGEWEIGKNFIYFGTKRNGINSDAYQFTYHALTNNVWDLICDETQFNQCIDEMATNYGTSETYSDYKVNYTAANDDIKPMLVDDNSRQAKLSNIGNILHNLSCSMDDGYEQDQFGEYASYLWDLSVYFRESEVGVSVKPVTVPKFTKEMAVAGTLPSVGFKLKYQHEFIESGEYQYLSNESGAGWEDGDSLEVISLRVNSHGEDVAIVLNTQEDVLTCAALTVEFFKSLTPPIELKDKGLYLFDINNRTEIVGRSYFTDFGDCWMITDLAANRSYDANKCTNIQLLEVKS
ncbi:MAG: hypothetical protein JKY50_00565 [Oleispira sp.]|nr:hypothetical protein [Oleispira sp.]